VFSVLFYTFRFRISFMRSVKVIAA